MKILLRPISFLWKMAAQLKNEIYNRGGFRTHKVPAVVVSVGNLTMGGTGKTPIVLDLAAELSRTLSVAIISKSYRGSLTAPALVNPSEKFAAAKFGDEATLISKKLNSLPVFSGPVKWQTAKFALDTKPDLQVLILDDGFQHRQLSRNFDLVVIDATEAWENYQCIPEGRAREAWENLQRANAIVITRTNLVPDEKIQFLRAKLPPGLPIFTCALRAAEIEEWDVDGNVINVVRPEVIQNLPINLVSAIGQPEQFAQLVREIFGKEYPHRIFSDHHHYQASELSDLQIVLTTEKDAVKLIFPRSFRLFVLKTKYEWNPGIQQLAGHIKI